MLTKYCQELKSRRLTLSAWLLVIYSFGIGLSLEIGFNIIFALVTEPEPQSCFTTYPFYQNDFKYDYLVLNIQYVLLSFLYPILGWFSDTKIGRYRVVTLSIWSCWFGTCLQVVSYCIQYGTCGLPANIAKYGISMIALIFLMFGSAFFFPNILAFGMDQLCDGSSAQIRAYIHWVVWGLFLGFLTNYIGFVDKSITESLLVQIIGLVTVAILSIIVCISILFESKFIRSGPLIKNPYKLVYKVLKYAKEHRSPVNRSALTYWQNESPSRIEFGKEKYGGPYKEDEVEDVKSFLRIVAVLLSTFGVFIPYYTVIFGIFTYVNKIKGSTSDDTNTVVNEPYILWASFNEIILIIVPLFELLIIPCFPKIDYFLMKPLRWFGFAHVLLLVSLMAILAIDTASDLITDNFACVSSMSFQQRSVPFGYYIYIIPISLIGIIEMLSFITGFEFICSQSPANMSGMLTGVFLFIRYSYIAIGYIITNSIFYVPNSTVDLLDTSSGDRPPTLTCTFWVLLLQSIICLFGGVVYILVTKWYKKREKGDKYDLHATVESHYIHMLGELNDHSDVEYIILDSD